MAQAFNTESLCPSSYVPALYNVRLPIAVDLGQALVARMVEQHGIFIVVLTSVAQQQCQKKK